MDMMRKLLFSVAVAAALTGISAAETNSITAFVETVRNQVSERIRARLGEFGVRSDFCGTVTHSAPGFFFIQSGDEALKVVVSSGRAPGVGDVVSVTGRPTLEGGHVVFEASSWRKTGSGVLPRARAAEAADLTFAASSSSEHAQDVNGRRVTVEGRAVGVTESGFAVDVDSMPVTVVASEYPDFIATSDATRPIVRVTGVVETVLDQSVLFGRGLYVMGVKLHLASPADVELRPDLVYLANVRDRRVRLGVLTAFGALAALALALVVILLRQARRRLRTRTLMDERKRMADDLHDTIEQHLVGAGMLLQLGKIKETLDILNRAKHEMRDIVWGLKNDDMMRLTPAEMLREYAKDENRKGVYRIDTRLQGLPAHLDAAQMRDLSLIVREAVGNAVKHGGAKKIALSSDPLEGGGWILRLGNDGAPFDPETSPGAKEGHFGIEGMRARARRLGATLSFLPKNGRVILVLEKKS